MIIGHVLWVILMVLWSLHYRRLKKKEDALQENWKEAIDREGKRDYTSIQSMTWAREITYVREKIGFVKGATIMLVVWEIAVIYGQLVY